MSIKRIIMLGATGSIGINSFDVIKNLGTDFQVVGAACHSNAKELIRLGNLFNIPNLAVSGMQVDDPRIIHDRS